MKKQIIHFQNVVFLSIFFLFFISAHSQSLSSKKIAPDPRLYECFSKAAVDAMVKDNPRQLLYYNFYLNNAFFVSPVDNHKPSQGLDVFKVECKDAGPDGEVKYFSENINNFDVTKFNVLKYKFKTDPDSYVHYLLGNTGRLIIFYPQKQFAEKYREYLKSFNIDTDK